MGSVKVQEDFGRQFRVKFLSPKAGQGRPAEVRGFEKAEQFEHLPKPRFWQVGSGKVQEDFDRQ